MHIVPKDRRPAGFSVLRRFLQHLPESVPIEDVVSQHHRAGIVPDELLAQQKRLGQSVRARLHLVLEVDPELASVAQQVLKPRGIVRRGDNQDLPDPRQHQRAEGVVNHGFVIYR